jgi:hypothetical protein
MAHQIAQGIAALGRGDDSMLVHMTPGEVESLQKLAMAKGGSLTVNPHTGLPEAGFLSSFLPMLAGVATTAMGFGPVGAGIAGGLTGLLTADKGANPLMSFGLGALGGYGGGGLGETLGSAGAQAAEIEAAKTFAGTLTPLEGDISLPSASQEMVDKMAAAKNATWTNADAATRAETLGKGLGVVANDPMKYLTKSNMMSLGSALVPVGLEAMKPKPLATPNLAPVRYYSTKFNPGTQVVDAQGRASYTGRGYEPGTFTTEYPTIYQAAQGGPVPTPNDNRMYPMSNLAMGKAGFNVQSSPTANEVVGGYDARIDPFTGAQMMAAGGIASLPEYAAGGKLLRGPGDGMSDDIPAVIKGAQEQRAALADGEFVIPADVVSHLGNGSTEAGAKQLYKMMDKIRYARTGNPKQGKQINPDKYMPA